MEPRFYDVAHANEVLRIAHERISNEVRPTFGSHMLSLDQDLFVDWTICHRFLNKFEEPSKSHDSALQRACFEQWVDIERELGAIHLGSTSPTVRSTLYKARALIHDWCKNYKRSSAIDFSPGETFVSNQGKTSIVRKLATRKHWTVTSDAFDDAAKMIYNNPGLKRMARRFMKPISKYDAKVLYSMSTNRFEAFKTRLEDVLIITQGSRLSSVYKNRKSRRCINVESLFNLLLQRQAALGLREILCQIDNDLEIGQLKHQRLIANSGKATVDFSSASDRVHLQLIEWLFPSRVVDDLKRYRSFITYVGDTAYVPRKLSSMGCGFTFEVMTMAFLAIARSFDPSASVYGDDVIICNERATDFSSVMTAVGLKVNEGKSFIKSPLRESCGSFYMDGYGYITCFDFKWCETWQDVTVNANKLQRILADYRGNRSSLTYQILNDAHCHLVSSADALSIGPLCDSLDCGYIQVPPKVAKKKQRKSSAAKQLWNDVISSIAWFLDDNQLDQNAVTLARVLHLVPKTGWTITGRFKDQGPSYTASILAGRVARDVLRNEYDLVWKLHVCCPHGRWTVQEIKELQARRKAFLVASEVREARRKAIRVLRQRRNRI